MIVLPSLVTCKSYLNSFRMAGNIYIEIELKSTVDKIWDALMDSVDLFPKVSPQGYKSIQVLEGDGKSLGNVVMVQFGEEFSLMQTLKERIEAVDAEKKTIVYNIFDGDFHKYCKTFKTHLEVNPKGDGSLIKWSCEFEEPTEEISHLSDMIKDGIIKFFHGLDDHLLKA